MIRVRAVRGFGRAANLAALMMLNGDRPKREHRGVWVLEDGITLVDSVHDRTVHYRIGGGALTDLASAPWFLHWMIDPAAVPWLTAAAAHDHGYASLASDRATADRWFRQLAIADGAHWSIAWVSWAGLRLFAWPAWRHNRRRLAESGPRWRYLEP